GGGSSDGEARAFDGCEQLEGIVCGTDLALVVIKAIILRSIVPPSGHEGSTFWGHELGELALVHKGIADVIIRAAGQSFFQESESGVEDECGLKSRVEHRMVERHVPFVNDCFCGF